MTHSVQVGAFLTKEYSVDLVDTLQQKGYDARIVVITDSSERAWYTVRIGDYPSHSSAQQYAEAFSSRENMQTAVRPYGKF
jgi:cell division protein FtsN